jgi:hypothetical protein
MWSSPIPCNPSRSDYNLSAHTTAEEKGMTIMGNLLKFVVLISIGSAAGALLGWLSSCTGGG